MTCFSHALVAAAVACGVTLAASQAAPPPAARPDSPDVRARIGALRTTAGEEWAEAFEFICALNPNRANRPDDPEIEPTRFTSKLQRLKQRTAGQPHPFVVGRDAYRRFLEVMSGCTNVQLARRAGA